MENSPQFPSGKPSTERGQLQAAERNEQWMERRYVRMDLEQEEQLRLSA